MNRSPSAADDPRVQQLARAMCAGLERRHWPGLVPVNAPAAGYVASESGAALLQYADLLHFPAVAKPGPFNRLIRLLRGAARPLIRPWLAVQTEFNRHTLQSLQGAYRELAILRARLEELQEQAEGRLAQATAAAIVPGKPAASESILERIFVHTRLPPPPARVLCLGGAAQADVLELASFGYWVVAVGRQFPALRHPCLAVIGADAERLPLVSAGFDVAVGLFTAERAGLSARTAVEITRVLRPGGRLLLTLPYARQADSGIGTDELWPAFRPVETLYAIHDGENWSVAPDAGTSAAAVRRWAVALIVAERI